MTAGIRELLALLAVHPYLIVATSDDWDGWGWTYDPRADYWRNVCGIGFEVPSEGTASLERCVYEHGLQVRDINAWLSDLTESEVTCHLDVRQQPHPNFYRSLP